MLLINDVMELVDLPPELLVTLLSYLDGVDLARVAQTCHTLRDVLEADLLWQKRCVQEFSFPVCSKWNGIYKDVYSKVLHKYGYLLGLWEDCSNCYGGLVQVWYTDECNLLGEELYSPVDVSSPLLRKSLFQISLTTDLQVKVMWLVPELYGDQAVPCNIQKTSKSTTSDGNLRVTIEWPPIEQLPREEELKAQQVMMDESIAKGADSDIYSHKWETIKHQRFQTLRRHKPFGLCPVGQVPFQPGLFRAVYGGHGTEIICVTYQNDYKDLVGMKVSGDPNVPAQEVSISANMHRPVQLTEAEQQQLMLVEQKTKTSEEGPKFSSEMLKKEPFHVPYGVYLREGTVPDHCFGRFHCLGTVSPTGYLNPSKVLNNLMIVDEDTFLVLWIPLYSLSKFCRVKDQLPLQHR